MDVDLVCVVLFFVVEFEVGKLVSMSEFRCWFGLRILLCSDFDHELDSGSYFYFGDSMLNWILNWFCLVWIWDVELLL